MGWLSYTICPDGYVEGHSLGFWIAIGAIVISIFYVCTVMLLNLNLALPSPILRAP